MASEFRRRTLLNWSVIGAAGYGLRRAIGTDEDGDPRARKAGKRWHTHPFEAFAVSPDGRFLATGARPMRDSLSDASEGVVLWSVDHAAGLLRVPLPGGVRRAEAPFSALSFSPDGSKLAAVTRRNEVQLIDVASGAVSGHYPLSAIEPTPRFFFSQSGEQLFVAATTLPGAIGNVFTVGSLPLGRPVRFDRAGALPFRLDERGLHVVAGGEYRIIAADGTPTTVATLLPSEPTTVAVDVSRKHLALAAGSRIATVDLETGQTKLGERGEATSVSMSLDGVPLGFSWHERSWSAYRCDDSLAQQLLFTSPDFEGERLPDGLPAALSPDGRHALELSNAGALRVWSVGHTVELLGTLGPFKHARAVCWPREGLAVVFGPQLLAFCQPLLKNTLESFEFSSW